MSWFSAIAGLFRPAKELIEVFKPNAESSAERDHVERMALSEQDLAALQEFAAEFHAREGRTWWDSFIDGLNRLPRPLITLGILAFFVLAPLQPVLFLEVAKIYALMPDGFWALLSVVVAFYFGGRMQLKRQDMAVKGGAIMVARDVMAQRTAAREAAARPALPPAVAPPPGANRVVEEWHRHQAAR
jgi:hypothetical protein